MIQVFVNGINIYRRYGAQLCRGGIEALLAPSSNKDYVATESRLRNGVKYQTEKIYKKEREVTLSFFIEGSTYAAYLNNYECFFGAIDGLSELRVLIQEIEKGLVYTKLDRTYKLVYLSSQQYGNFGTKKGKFAIKFIEPDPTDRVKGHEVI